MIETAIYTIGAAHAGLTALIGTRLYPEAETAEHATPRVVYELHEQEPVSGVAQNTGWFKTWIIFVAYGATALEAKQVIDQLYACYDRYSGTVSGHTIDPTYNAARPTSRVMPGDFSFELGQFYQEIEVSFFHN